MGVGREAPLNKGMKVGVRFSSCKTPFTNLKMRRNLEEHSKYVIPATSRVDNVLCGHSRIVRELPLILFLLFADIMRAHNCLLLTIPRVASESESNHPVYSNDRFVSWITSSSVRPPQTAASLMRYLCKIEGLALQNCILFQSLSEMATLDDSIHLSLQGTAGPGTSDLDPMALVVNTRAVEKKSQVTSTVQPRQLFECNYEQYHGAALLCLI